MSVIKVPQSQHAFKDEALLILSIDPKSSPNRKYLTYAANNGLIIRYPRGKRNFVYDRPSLLKLAKKLDKGEVLIDTSDYSFQHDF